MRKVLKHLPDKEAAADPLQYQRRILERMIAVLDGKSPPLVYPDITKTN